MTLKKVLSRYFLPGITALALSSGCGQTTVTDDDTSPTPIDCTQFDSDNDGYFTNTECGNLDECDDNADSFKLYSGYADNDNDGYGAGTLLEDICGGASMPSGFSPYDSDCDDSDANLYTQWSVFPDTDGDGQGDETSSQVELCGGNSLPEGYQTNATDCDDTNSLVFLGATELCDYLDNDCNGSVDEVFTDLGDACDNGQIGTCYTADVMVCSSTQDATECGAPTVTPGEEFCDGVNDNNCDGNLDCNGDLYNIVFESASNGIMAIKSNGSYLATAYSDSSANLTEPTLSPDALQVAFVSDTSGYQQIYLMDMVIGTTPTNISPSSTHNYAHPQFSPDGTQLLYQSDENGNWDIGVMNSDGTSPSLIITSTDDDTQPAWSPDGSYVAFTRETSGIQDVYKAEISGSNQTNLTNASSSNDSSPTWGPLGRDTIYFQTDRDSNFEIYNMNLDGSWQLNRSSNSSASDYSPSASTSTTNLKETFVRDGDIWTMNNVGTDQTSLTSIGDADNPHWGYQP